MSARHLRIVPTPRPFSLGFHGHAAACECGACCYARAQEHVLRCRKLGIRVTDPRATVMVRSYTVKAHARRSKAHLNAFPKTKAKLVKLLRKEGRGNKS